MEKAVLYTREPKGVTDFGESITGQEIRLVNYCVENNIEVSRVYHDISIEDECQRTQFIRMLYDLANGAFEADLCLFTSAEKLSEDFDEFFFYSRLLKSFGLQPMAIKPTQVFIILM